MKWFQHDTDAIEDVKLVDLAEKYGAEGLGIYWLVVERIAKKMDKKNPTLELEEETRHIVRLLGERTPGDRVDAVLKYCEDLGLFDRGPSGKIRCRTLLRKLDNFTANNAEIRKMKGEMEHFVVGTKSLIAPTYQPTLPTDPPTHPALRTVPSAEELFELEKRRREKAG